METKINNATSKRPEGERTIDTALVALHKDTRNDFHFDMINK